MALHARVKSVEISITTPILDDNGQPTGDNRTIDLTETGEILVSVEYVDDSNPSEVLREKSFQVPSSMTEEEIQDRILGYATRVLRTYQRHTELQQYIGVMVPIPEPGA